MRLPLESGDKNRARFEAFRGFSHKKYCVHLCARQNSIQGDLSGRAPAQCSYSAYDIKMSQCFMIYACNGYKNDQQG